MPNAEGALRMEKNKTAISLSLNDHGLQGYPKLKTACPSENQMT